MEYKKEFQKVKTEKNTIKAYKSRCTKFWGWQGKFS